MTRPPLIFLSTVWISLCTSLVAKRNELISVFFAFIGSFFVAFALAPKSSSVANGDSADPVKSEPNGRASAERINRTKIKDMVGMMACFLSGTLLLHGSGSDFYAVAVVTGYLAFDLWYTPLCRPLPSICSIWEDAVTLTIFLVALERHSEHEEAGSSSVTVPGFSLLAYRRWVFAWLVYKIGRLACHLWTGSGPRSVEEGEIVHWTIHGVSYDLSKFVNVHPGGKEAVELGRGRDCTALFESYHPFTERHKAVLQKYKPVKEKKTLLPEDKFYDTLKTRVFAVLKENGIDPITQRCATKCRLAYYSFLVISTLVSATFHAKGNPFGSFLFSLCGWLLGCLGHDAGHFAVSRTPWINDMAVWGISFVCNPVMWQHQHTYAHHSDTNDFDKDPDLHHFTTFLRIHKKVKRDNKIYPLQIYPLYVFWAYTFVVFGTCLWIPLDMIKNGSLYGIVEWTDRHRPIRALGMIAHFVLYFSFIVVSPFVVSQKSKPIAALCVLISFVVTGLLFAIFSQINHINELCMEENERTRYANDEKLNQSWAAKQVSASNNFAPNSSLWHFLSNGLNLQIEHHLFPSLNHCHLPVIAPVVQKTCEEFGVTYKVYDTWADIMEATLSWVKTLEMDDVDVSVVAPSGKILNE